MKMEKINILKIMELLPHRYPFLLGPYHAQEPSRSDRLYVGHHLSTPGGYCALPL